MKVLVKIYNKNAYVTQLLTKEKMLSNRSNSSKDV